MLPNILFIVCNLVTDFQTIHKVFFYVLNQEVCKISFNVYPKFSPVTCQSEHVTACGIYCLDFVYSIFSPFRIVSQQKFLATVKYEVILLMK